MPNARDDKDRLQHNKKRRHAESVSSTLGEIGDMHFAAENYSTAIEYFHKALDTPHLKDYPDRFRLLCLLGDCHRRKGGIKEARLYFEQARGLIDGSDHEAAGRIEYREGYVLVAQGKYEEALKQGFSAYRRLKHTTEHKEVGEIQLMLAHCYLRLGFGTEAEEFYMDALSSFRRIEDRVGIAIVYNNLGVLHKNACRWQRALASLGKSLELARELGVTQHLIRVQLNMGIVYGKLRRFMDAVSVLTSAEKMAERFGDQHKLTKVSLALGRTHVGSGDFVKAEKYILRGQAMANELGYAREAALADEYLGELMIARGMHEEALVNLEKGLVKAREIAPEGDITAEILRRLADVRFKMNRTEDAMALVDEGLELAHKCGELYEIGYYYRTKGLCQRRRRDFAEAAKSLETSIDRFEKYGNPHEQHVSQQILGRFYLVSRDQQSLLRAKRILNDSVIGFGKLEDPGSQVLSQVLLASVEERLGNLDEALLAIYEADRLSDGDDEGGHAKLLGVMRARIERKMARDTRHVLEQIPMFADIQTASQSRGRLVSSLDASLRLVREKLNAESGFVAIPKQNGKGLDVVCRDAIASRDAKAILSWYISNRGSDENHHWLMVTNGERETDLEQVRAGTAIGPGTLVFQSLGFENENLGLIFVHHKTGVNGNPFGQEALHFVGAYSRLISLSVYELIRNERRREIKPKPSTGGFESIVTENNEMIKLLTLAERVAHSNATVLLQGETGTGKGLIAYAIHLLSERRDKKFVHVNCAAMPEPLLESELFGHKKGAFTGAISDKDGLLHQADGGTVFLDEIGKTTLSMQGKLLQFLDTCKVRRVGSNDLRPIDVRVICASKADLMDLCNDGRFLEDFFYRINDFPLTVPPLRNRKEDVALLFFHYLGKFAREMDKDITDVSDEALALLRDYHWAGNVRELEKVVKRAVILAEGGETIQVSHLPPELLSVSGNGEGERKGGRTLRDQIDRLEKREIRSALGRTKWNKTQAAIELGISYPSLLSKIKRYNLHRY